MTKPKVMLCVDPGGTIGICLFNSEYQMIKLDQIPSGQFEDYLIQLGHEYEVTQIIAEDYVVLKHKASAHAGSRVPAAQQLGKLSLMAKIWGCPLVKQRASILKIAEMWSGIKMPHDHKQTHQWCAYLHGFYYLAERGLVKTKLEIEEEAKRNAQ